MRHSAIAVALLVPLAFTPGAAAQQSPTAGVRWVDSARVAEQRAQSKAPWLPLFTTPTLSMGRYALGKGAVDEQSPHARDEVYHVLAGKAKLQAGDEARVVAAGDTVFLAARVPHHFFEIEADLDLLVFFTAARVATGGMAAAPPPTEQTPFPETSQRGNTRIFYWFGPDSAGQVAIDFGRPRWQPAFAKFLQQPSGPRWRFGENFWTTLDTNMPLTLGGIDIAVGQYYLVLQRTEAGTQLVLLDPADLRRRRLDAYEANKTTGGITIPLQASKLEQPAAELDIELTVEATAKDTGMLSIRFGPHQLTAPLRMHPHR